MNPRKREKMTIPERFYCPITKRIMHDPVVDPEGHSYERTAIVQWLQMHSISPITRKPLLESELAPNYALKDAIEAMQAEHGDDWTESTEAGANVEPTKSYDHPDHPVEISVDMCSNEKGELLVTVKTPAGSERVPVDLVCVIDVSGSMDEMANIKKYDGNGYEIVECSGLTILDVVKHALKMIITSLSDRDRLALVTFSNVGLREFPLTVMNDAGKARVTAIVEEWRTRGCTNLWHGLEIGMDVFRESRGPSFRTRSLFLLTDGQPNMSPPRGEIDSLKRYLDTHRLMCSIHTFGFGYYLDSVMLDKLAVVGNGQYSFIPDAGMVGTVFIHALANLFVTVANNVKLVLEPLGDDTSVSVFGDDAIVPALEYVMGTLQLEQTKDVLFHIAGSPNLRLTLHYDVPYSMSCQTKVFETISPVESDESRRYLSCTKNRLRAVRVLRQAMQNPANAATEIERVSTLIKSGESGSLPNMVDLCLDLDKEGTAAFREDYFPRWGRHYVPSLSRAHLLQMCNNFKDPGVQHYGGRIFKSERDALDEIFNKLPPARPSRPVYDQSAGRHVYRSPVNMSMYNDSDDPCFLGSCMVILQDKTKKRLDELKKGDVLPNGAKIRCILKTNVTTGRADMVRLKAFNIGTPNPSTKNDKEDLVVTPWHPIYDFERMKWCFPAEIGSVMTVETDALYSILLDSYHIMDINDIPCVTLGHDFEDPVRRHPFFGSPAVVKEMQRFPGFGDGVVEISGTRRDPVTGWVNGFKFSTAYYMSNHMDVGATKEEHPAPARDDTREQPRKCPIM